jgi:hypothetical protein
MMQPWTRARLVALTLLLAAAPVAFPVAAQDPAQRVPAPEGAAVYFISPTDGATVTSPLTVRFGMRGMGVAPAGVEQPKTGHHHLLIDAELPALDLPIPADEHHVHFGGGQTEVVLELPPGEHTLQLLVGDARHVPHDPPIVSDRVTVQVSR